MIAARQQRFDQMRTNKPRAASDENSLHDAYAFMLKIAETAETARAPERSRGNERQA